MNRFARLLSLSCAAALCLPASDQVQTTTAITGAATDSSGAFLPGVNSVVKNDDTGAVREMTTNEAGHYAVQALRPGKYSITATMANFKTAVITGREVQVSIPAAVNFVLELGDVKHFAPRLGLVMQLTSKTMLRLAGGIFYANNVNTNQFSDAQTGADPFIVRSTQVIAGSEQLPPLRTQGLFPAPAPPQPGAAETRPPGRSGSGASNRRDARPRAAPEPLAAGAEGLAPAAGKRTARLIPCNF